MKVAELIKVMIEDTKFGVVDSDIIKITKACVDGLSDRRKLRKLNEIVVEAMAYEDAPVA